MNLIETLKELMYALHQQRKYKDRQMKRIFQWRRYLEWKNLTQEEKLSAKRLLLVPVAAYLVFAFLKEYAVTLAFFICLYLLYKKFEKGKLSK